MRYLAELNKSLNATIIEICWKMSLLGTFVALLVYLSPYTKGNISELLQMGFFLIAGFGLLTYLYKETASKNLKYYVNVILIAMIFAIAITMQNPEFFNMLYFIMAINMSYRDRALHFISSAFQTVLYLSLGLIYPLLLPAATTEDSTVSLLITRITIFTIVVFLIDILNSYAGELNDKLNNQEIEIKTAALTDSVGALVQALEAKDRYTNGHSQRVSKYALIIAKHLSHIQLTEEDFYTAGLLHDIGKIGMPDSVLTKTGSLTDEEYALIKAHPVIGAKILENAKSLAPAIPMVLYHHERFDGKGYPEGLKGENIPLEARILAVADSFDAMTSDRPYRKALSLQDAYNEIFKQKGLQFCPLVTDAFESSFSEILTEYIKTH